MAGNQVTGRVTWLRDTLQRSRKEAFASALMTGTCDNYLGAFAIALRASLVQMSWLTAAPQLIGALSQLLSVWLCQHLHRKKAIVIGVGVQATAVLCMMLLALYTPDNAVLWLIGAAVVYHASANFVQPQWRGWMGSVVPARRRGAYFAGRTRLTMITTLAVFAGGGALLGAFDERGEVYIGFALIFAVATLGRALSARQLARMHDPDPHSGPPVDLAGTLRRIRDAFRHRTFRRYTLFVAGMQGAVAVSAPFFSVYMLRDLDYSYWQFSINTGASILTQFFTLAIWGRLCDQWGNRFVMIASSSILPLVPALWLFSSNYYYLILVQVVSGLAWGGFTLSTANYLYDLRPPRADFASYAAVQSALSAIGIFCGALVGGLLARHLDVLLLAMPPSLAPAHALLLIMLVSSLLRLLIVAWFIPHSEELRVRRRPDLLRVVYRISRFTPGAGVVLDWLTVTRAERAASQDMRQEESSVKSTEE
ncbi:MAG: MFS transporter [Halieaceae bacterium]|jgi:MFS family permease|nr:MFS transporter [Halieaceae bacterium]